jgi:hypothetical protein
MNKIEKTYTIAGKEYSYRKILNWDYRRAANELTNEYEKIERKFCADSSARFLALSANFLQLAEEAAEAQRLVNKVSRKVAKSADLDELKAEAHRKNEIFQSAVNADLKLALEYQEAYKQYESDKEKAKLDFIYKFGKELVECCIEHQRIVENEIRLIFIEIRNAAESDDEFEKFLLEVLEDFFSSWKSS